MEPLQALLQQTTTSTIARTLGLAPGTVKRWIELQNVPEQYTFDLLRMLGQTIDYTKYTPKQKDQFFTPGDIAARCWEIFQQVVPIDPDDYNWVEPSAGDGSFLEVLPETTLAFDIEPRHERIQQQDYLQWTPQDTSKPYVVFGDPPFGLRGHIALQFINHSAAFADYVCFILPQFFESDGKGAPRKRVQGFHLLHSEKVAGSFRVPGSTDVDIHGVFQIWSKTDSNPKYALVEPKHKKLTVYSLSDGGTPSSTRNKDKLTTCDVYLPSTCFGRESMRPYDSFEELPGRKGYGIVFHEDRETLMQKCKETDWASVSFLSTNSALNLRTSIIHTQF